MTTTTTRTSADRRRSRSDVGADSPLPGLLALVAAVGGALAGCHPTVVPVANVVFSGALAGLVTLIAARSRRWATLWLTGIAAAAASGWILAPALLALGVALLSVSRPHRSRPLGAVSGALAVQALLRLPTWGFHGASALVVVVAVAPAAVSAWNASSRRTRRLFTRYLLWAGAVLAALTALFVVGLLASRSSLKSGVDQTRAALRTARQGDSDLAEIQLGTAADGLSSAHDVLASPWMWPSRLVPIVSQHQDALSVVTDQAEGLVDTAQVAVRSADVNELRYTDGRFDLDRIRAARQPLDRVATELDQASRQVSAVNSPWLLPPLGDRIDELSTAIDDAVPDAHLAADVAKVAPGMLGGDGTRRYFVAFVTPAELRGSGGFIGSYGELTADNGKLRLVRSGPIADLIDARAPGERTLLAPRDYLNRYGRFSPADYFQDVTFSPDFASDAKVIEQLYPQSGGTEVDGVLSVDPYALAGLLTFTGPIKVDGLDEPLTAANAPDVLLKRQYESFDQRSERQDALVEAGRATFDKLTTGSLPGPRRVAEVMDPLVKQRRLMFDAVRPDEQDVLGEIGLRGEFPPPGPADFLSVVGQNTGNNKIDPYLQRTVHYTADYDPATGKVAAEATVELENSAPASGLPPSVIGNDRALPDGTNLMYLSVYTDQQLVRASLDGEPLKVDQQAELGHNVYSAFVAVPPGGTRSVRLQLEGAVAPGSRYRLQVRPQPVVNTDRYDVEVRPTAGWRIDESAGFSRETPGRATDETRVAADRSYWVRFRS